VPLTPKRLKAMEELIAAAMDEGALGFSIGLIYVPGFFAKEDELAELAAVAAKKGGIYATHMRNEADKVLDSAAATIETAKKANVSLQIVHLKAAGRRNWAKMEPLIEMIAKARAAGQPVDYDQYPYTAGSTGLVSLLPRWAQTGGMEKVLARLKSKTQRKKIAADLNNRTSHENLVAMTGWENVFISSVRSERNRAIEGKSLPDIAKRRGQSVTDALFDILMEENCDAAMIVFSMSEENVTMGLKVEWGMVGSDGLFGGRSHPRLHGTFPRVLGKYSRDEKVIPLELAVKKMTSLPAEKLGLSARGVIARGKKADLVLFDPKRIKDGATYEDPLRFAEGIARVIVNGKTVMLDGKFTGARPGRVVRKGK
jgi:N-acyl-D-amino-acid deacylase